MRIFKRILTAALFVGILAAVSLTLDYLMIPYTFTRMKVHAVENNTYDDLILGSSHGATNIDPDVLGGITGRTTYNAAQGEEFPVDSYYLLKDACIANKPGRLIYEFDSTYWLSAQETDSSYALTYYSMRRSFTKMQYFYAKMWNADFRTWSAPWYFFRDRIYDIGTNLYVKGTDDYKDYGTGTFESDRQSVTDKGFIAIKNVRWDDAVTVRPWTDDMIQKSDVAYFLRIVSYCKENDISLVVVTTPVPDDTYEAGKDNFDQAGFYMSALADQYGFTYANYNNDRLEGLDTTNAAYADYDGHMYEESAEAFSRVFGERLKTLEG